MKACPAIRAGSDASSAESDRFGRFAFDSAADGIFVIEGGRLIDVNKAACRMFGRKWEELIGHSIEALSADDPIYTQRQAVGWLKQDQLAAPRIFEWHYRASNGQAFWAELSLQHARFGRRYIGIVVARDISQRQTVSRLARRDRLTGLPNRWDFDLALGREIARHARSGTPLAVAMADIDHFKVINDSFGHPTGDIVLKDVAQFMRACLRRIDYLARWGGDEFAFLLLDAEGPAAEILLNRLRHSIARHEMPAIKSAITLSFGVTTLLKSDTSASVIERADRGLYLSKQNQRNRVTRV